MRRFLALLFLLSCTPSTIAQTTLPVLQSGKKKISIRNGNILLADNWTITPELKPDVWDVVLPADSIHRVTFITDVDSLSFDVRLGERYDFIILLNHQDAAYTSIATHPIPATFSDRYTKNYLHQTVVEVPEVYELVNIILALTSKGIADSDLVIHSSSYYQEMRKWFDAYRNEIIVRDLDSALQNSFWSYFNLKMDAYSFEFQNQQIVRSPVYDRVSWGPVNTLLPYLDRLQMFSDHSNFQQFYQQHVQFYQSQISYYQDTLALNEMQQWLNRNFPTTSYDCIKVIFSPLVGYSQSANWFESNGFKEAQAHVNFPYPDASDIQFSPLANQLRNECIVFTEVNHAFINPESEKYLTIQDFQAAFRDLTQWESANSGAVQGYNNANSCFNEYVNWSLVSLRWYDLAPRVELERMLMGIEKNQIERGFSRFPEFNRKFLQLYSEREQGQTVADLYPKIIRWCRMQVK